MKKLTGLFLSVALALSLCTGFCWAGNVPAALSEICLEEEWEVLKLTNRERLANGQAPLSTFGSIQRAAHVRKQELITQYSHTRPNGFQCFTALTESGLGYTSAGENIAAGQGSPKTVVEAWMNSSGHRENILDQKFTHIGIGYTDQKCTVVTSTGSGQIKNGWVQLFVGDKCSITAIALSQPSVSCPQGTSLDDLNLFVEATCSVHGSCYLPLLTGMCTGFDPNSKEAQSVTVTYAGKTAQLKVNAGTLPLDTSGADSWAVDWLKRADALGLLSERNRTQFTANITRLQFADLAVTLTEKLTGSAIPPAPESSFTDTTEAVILKAKAAGIAGGYQVGAGFEFRPSNPITRQEICVMLAHVVDYVNQHGDKASSLDRSESINNTFSDTDKVASWAVKQVALMTNNGIMGGRAAQAGLMIAPEANTSLQEAVTLTVKLCDLLK